MQKEVIMRRLTKRLLPTLLALPVAVLFIGFYGHADTMSKEQPSTHSSNIKTATLAGGCFWCTESDLEQLPGVTDVISGYAGGNLENPTYRQVSSGKSGHIEVISVKYDADAITYIDVLDQFFRHIDPTDAQGSFVDRGLHYRPAVFYHNDVQKQQASDFMLAIENAGIFPKPLATELIKFEKFWPAEEYHQDYYKKSSVKYKYYRYRSGRDQYLDEVFGDDRKEMPITLQKMIEQRASQIDAKQYAKPSDKQIKSSLSELQYYVTQEDGTERPFNNEYWDNKKDGIYVDVVSGEPLFSSLDKYKSGTGWPSFTKPINDAYVVTTTDYKLLYPRTEVRSRYADSHLGHVFKDGPEPTGLRYCMNSAAMRFVSVEQLEKEGYGEYLVLFNG